MSNAGAGLLAADELVRVLVELVERGELADGVERPRNLVQVPHQRATIVEPIDRQSAEPD